MKNLDNNEEDIYALFECVLGRINKRRKIWKKIRVTEEEKRRATAAYVKDHPNDFISWGDP